MRRQLLPILAIILGSAFLMVAGGIQGLVLPLRGALEGFPTLSLGLLGTGWAAGYIAGCLYTPWLVRRVGHVRTFGAMASICVISVLLTLILIHPTSWIVLRGVTGFCFAGAAMIAESWLNERADNKVRGRIFGIYSMANLGAVMVGQMMIPLGSPSGYVLFVLAAIFYALAVLPTAISTASAPKPLVETGLDLKALWRNSPIAFFAAFLIGISNSAYGTLGAVFGGTLQLSTATIALMMSLPLLAGAALQIPVGYLSDKTDRRLVLIGLALIAIAADLFFILAQPSDRGSVLAAAVVFGGAIYTIYPVIIAHASDKAEPGTFIKISGGLLLMYGIGGIIGPLISGLAMSSLPRAGLFLTTFCAHVLIAAYAVIRISQRQAVAEENKSSYVGMMPGRYATPETSALDPRAQDAAGSDRGDGDAPADRT
ncbi:MAG: MFS transporter [Nitratireductor sp.]|nr:MFS transporter [Nitratireductor sp.]